MAIALQLAAALASLLIAWDACRRTGGSASARWLAVAVLAANPAWWPALLGGTTAALLQLAMALACWGLLRYAVDDAPSGWRLGASWMGVALLLAAAGYAHLVTLEQITARALGLGPEPAAGMDTLLMLALGGPAAGLAVIGALRMLRDRAGSGTRRVGLLTVVGVAAPVALGASVGAVAGAWVVAGAAGASQVAQWSSRVLGSGGRWVVQGLVVAQLAWAGAVVSGWRP